jgi:TonB-linked SusC/RagA family outer membrane protein
MTVLKGATAAALYGSRAKDGVIMITTKTRGTGEGIGVAYNLNFTDETPLDFTDYQYEYGQGEYGVRPTSANPTSGQWSFGERIQPGMTQVLFNNVTVPYEAQRGIVKQFYRHGQNFTNTVTLSTNGEKGGMNLSFANLESKGITPNNTYNRKTINLGFSYELSDKLSFRGSANYSKEHNKNPPIIGEQDNSIPTALFAMANTMPLSVLDENKYNAQGGEYIYSRFTNRTNPYWAMAEQFQNIRRDRLFGNVSVKYQLLKWLSVQGRVGQDFWSRDQEYVNLPTGKASISSGNITAAVPGFVNGLFTQEVRRFRETNLDFLLIADKEFGDFGVNVTFGGNQMRRRSDLNSVQVTDFIVRRLYTVQNGRAKDPTYTLTETGVNSLYGAVEFNYKRFIYLNATAREDWFSTLAGENHVFYPSISTSYIFSEHIATLPNWLDLGKFRAAHAQVGSDNDVGAYQDVLFYGLNANFLGGQPVGTIPASVPNATLHPMKAYETEFGLELRMFDNRVGIDAAVYEKITKDQIVSAQISDASSFTTTRINRGKSRNRGVELMLNLVPVRSDDFEWSVTFAGSYNKTKVLSLLTDTPGESITVGAHVFNGFLQQIVGQEMGQIVGYGYRRDDGSIDPDHKGQIVYGSNGIPLPTQTLIPFGSALPKWVGGITNSFNYKGIALSVLIDFKLGGKLLSGTNFNAYRHGLHKATLVGREGGVVGEGVDINSNVNEAVAVNQDYYSVVRGSGLIEPVVYNGGYVKLRQITLGYDFTKFLPENGVIKGIRLNFVANNVFMLKKWVDNIDPETFGYSSDNLVGMESPGVPSTRSLGANLNVKF